MKKIHHQNRGLKLSRQLEGLRGPYAGDLKTIQSIDRNVVSGHKISNWSQVPEVVVADLPKMDQQMIAALEKDRIWNFDDIVASGSKGPLDDFDAYPDDNIFILKDKGTKYLVDRQGYGHARYIWKLI